MILHSMAPETYQNPKKLMKHKDMTVEREALKAAIDQVSRLLMLHCGSSAQEPPHPGHVLHTVTDRGLHQGHPVACLPTDKAQLAVTASGS